MYGKNKSPVEKRGCFKMTPKSPMLKALKGDQDKLPKELQQAILASPAKIMNENPKLAVKKKATKINEVEVPKIGVEKKATKRNQVEVPRIGMKKKVTPPAPTKKKCKKCGSPMCMCGPKHRK